MAKSTQTTKPKAARKPRAQRSKDPEQAKTKLARAAYLQRKMDVSTPGDAHEQEADRVAEGVSRMPRGVARSAEAETVPPGSSKPSGNAAEEQSLQTSLQTKISRVSDEPEAATKLARDAEESADRQAEPTEQADTKLARAEQETEQAATKLSRAADEETADRTATDETADRDATEEPSAEQTTAETGNSEEETADGENTPVVSDETEQQINALKGQGKAMDESVRKELEAKMNADFSEVSIHTSGEADALCKQLSARAFTVGNDIFFAAGEYAPDSEAGRKLLAHELTHVVQQEGGASRKVYRAGAGGGGPATDDKDKFSIDVNKVKIQVDVSNPSEVRYDKLPLPPFKLQHHTGQLRRRKQTRTEDENQQRENWASNAGSSTAIIDFVNKAIKKGFNQEPNNAQTYVFEQKPAGHYQQTRIIFGAPNIIAKDLAIATWDRQGKGRWFQVDHKKELQLEGQDDPKTNMWLLNRETNRASGFHIQRTLRSMAARVGDHEKKHAKDNNRALRKTLSNANKVFELDNVFDQAVKDPTYGKQNVPNRYYWDYPEISAGDHLKISKAAPKVEKDELGSEKKVYLFPFPTGGVGRQFRNSDKLYSGENKWDTVKPWKITSKSFNTEESQVSQGNFGQLGLILEKKPGIQDNANTINLDRVPGARFAGYIRNAQLIQDIGALALKGMSPIKLDSFGVTEVGFSAHGQIAPSVPLIGDANVEFMMEDGDIRVFKQFDTGEVKVPSPFSIDNCSLTASASLNDGLGLEGKVEFGIERVGKGHLGAAVSSKGKFELDGEFNFDERLFGEGSNAQVRMAYKDEVWSMGGTITIPKGKVPGIETATIDVNYSEEDGFSALGDATLNVPGVESGKLAITQSKDEGFSIGGKFNLSADSPGIRGGSIEALVKEKPDGSGYAVSAKGEAEPDIPGINSKLLVSYDDGAFTAEIEADYSRGMLSGKAKVGVTNRSVGEDGQLSQKAEEGNPLIVYGGGQLKLQLAPWLQGTAGVEFSPAGELTVVGEIGLPDEIEIFRRYQVNKDIFSISVKAPIFPGIVAEIGGGLSAQAGIGPGVIDKLKLGVTYNPDHEEDTQITGDAHLNIPADAGLRLFVRAGIGLGITGASATGGLEIGGTLGIEGAAEAGVHIEWTPTKGLAIDANVGIHAQPSFTFDIGGYVTVEALWFTVYSERWKFASYTYGSDYRFGISLPIHYREGEPFDISLDDVKFEVPNINTSQLLRGLVDRIS